MMSAWPTKAVCGALPPWADPSAVYMSARLVGVDRNRARRLFLTSRPRTRRCRAVPNAAPPAIADARAPSRRSPPLPDGTGEVVELNAVRRIAMVGGQRRADLGAARALEEPERFCRATDPIPGADAARAVRWPAGDPLVEVGVGSRVPSTARAPGGSGGARAARRQGSGRAEMTSASVR
jgi:hypothetical protein